MAGEGSVWAKDRSSQVLQSGCRFARTGQWESSTPSSPACFARPIRSRMRPALAAFMDSRAAFLAQKCVVEFCRVRAGVYWQKLFSEKEFQEALDTSRWRAYPPAFAMVAEMVEGALREAAGLTAAAAARACSAHWRPRCFEVSPFRPARRPISGRGGGAGARAAGRHPVGPAAAGARDAEADGAHRLRRPADSQGHRDATTTTTSSTICG